ncbi:MAG: ABC transporter permease subunit [Patescibacteria group bacterium]|jgi:ABC-2 type transport system permease protein|nr:ABC transporter permease subunit [Patescibacteria group bacterium]
MFNLIKRSLRDRKYQVIIYSAAAIGFLEMYIALFPALQKQAQQMSKLLETYPDSFWKAFNIDKSTLTFDKLGPYLGMEQFNFVWPILAIVLVIGFANYAIANEMEKGTIELLLSQPVSRLKLFFSRYITGIINLLIFSILSILVIFPLVAIHGVQIDSKGVWVLFLLSFLFAWAIYGIATLASAVVSEKGKASFITAGILILMYVMNIVAGLKDSLKDLKYFSFFYYYNPTLAMNKGEFVSGALLVFASIAIITTLLAALWFNKRDVTV